MLSKDEYEQLDWLDMTRAFYRVEIERRKEFAREYSAYLAMTTVQILECNKRAKQAAPVLTGEKTEKRKVAEEYLKTATLPLEEKLMAEVIRKHKKISEKLLIQEVWKDIDGAAFDTVITRLLKTGEFTRTFTPSYDTSGTLYWLTSEWSARSKCK